MSYWPARRWLASSCVEVPPGRWPQFFGIGGAQNCKLAHAESGAPAGKGCYWDEHELVNSTSGAVIACPNWNGRNWMARGSCGPQMAKSIAPGYESRDWVSRPNFSISMKWCLHRLKLPTDSVSEEFSRSVLQNRRVEADVLGSGSLPRH